ncbi:MAG: amidohydrolase family protein [Hyphomicrobiales bacterium]|nr:amidohydrolase family protein [Hyphomicrobiales bacterium]
MKVIDTHIHYGTDRNVAAHTCCPNLITGDAESVIAFLDEQNASHGVLFPHDRVMSPPWDADYDKANAQVGVAATRYPDRIAGLARINPTFGGEHTQTLIDRYVDEWGCRGVKLVAGYDFYRPNDMSVMGPMLDKCEEYDLTVLFHSGDASRDLPYLQAQAAKAYPKVRFVLAHIGMHAFLWEAIIACQEYQNITVDMSQAFPFDIKTFVANVGADRLTYGSDAPYQSTRVEQEKLRVIDLDEADLRKVFRSNALRIWGFED